MYVLISAKLQSAFYNNGLLALILLIFRFAVFTFHLN